MAPGLKPTILCNGKPLIQHAYEHAWNDWKCAQFDTSVVVSPDNAGIITSLFPEHTTATFVVQPTANGIVSAIRKGLRTINQPWTLILCADNIFRLKDDHLKRDDNSPYPIFGARVLPYAESQRFTIFCEDEFHPASLDRGGTINSNFTCWIGPLLVRSENLMGAIDVTNSIVELLNILHRCEAFTELEMECSDMGILGEIQ